MLLSISFSVSGQSSDNPFAVGEEGQDMGLSPATPREERAEDMLDTNTSGDNPANPGAPIDDYIPFLVVAAIGLIAWKVRKRGVTL